MRSHRSRRPGVLLSLALGLAAMAGCARLPFLDRFRRDEATIRLDGENGSEPIPLTVLQAEAMRFADQYASTIEQAADRFFDQVKTPEARIASLSWKLEQATWAYIDASGSSPVQSALDLVVLTTVSRGVMEEDWVGKSWGDPAEVLLDAHIRLEKDAWAIARKILDPNQIDELRRLIGVWRARTPPPRAVGQARFHAFAEVLGDLSIEGPDSPGMSIFKIFFLDPLAGLDPATRELEQTRFLAERAMYYLQRMPTLLRWEAELMVAGGSQDLLEGLVAREAELGDALAEVRHTLDAGTGAASAIESATRTLDAFIEGLRGKSPPSAERRKPFDITEYRDTAEGIARAARDLDALLDSTGGNLPELQKAFEEAATRVERRIDRTFWMVAALIAILLAGLLLTAIVHRLLLRSR